MPASRSRTERWRECLDQIGERGGGLEVTIDRDQAPTPTDPNAVGSPVDLVWRVRLVNTTDDEIQVEQPSAMGQTIRLDPGTRIIVGMAIGQNRWMFKTTVLSAEAGSGRAPALVRLQMPTHVERCQRRNFYRMSTAELLLPKVQCWPLLDPTSVTAAEVANRSQILDLMSGNSPAGVPAPEAEPMVLPEVGPPFRAKLVNIGGGGAGLLVERGEGTGPDRSRLLWLRLNLTPQIPAPIAMTARIAHMHLDSAQNLYLGLAFDFSFHPAHREFVVGQICRYVLTDQDKQAARRAG
jgi:c-di-GMP-binding flagellar brake protein YcgR